jgi:hypothetical protein
LRQVNDRKDEGYGYQDTYHDRSLLLVDSGWRGLHGRRSPIDQLQGSEQQ